MDFLIKLIKELNSANSEKLMIWAILLGLISGFLPTFNIITFIIIFIVFSIRIPLGLYFASWGFFSIVGYFMDYIFHKTGLSFLHANALNSIWTTLYNTPLLRWSGFNNSIIMGSLIWGIILSIILYFILSKSISSYRTNIFPKIQKISYLRWILPKEEKKGLLRISGLAIISIISGAIISFFVFLTDPIIKAVLEFSLSKTLHKPVSIQKVTTSISNLSLDIHNAKISDFKTDDIYLQLSWKYLVWKKFDITKLIIKNMHTEKSIKTFIPKQKTTKTTKTKFNIHFDIPKASTLLANYNLETVQKIEKLKKDYKNLEILIKSINNNLKSQKENINQIKTEISKLDKETKNIKTANDIKSILTEVNNIKNQISAIKTDIKKYQKDLEKNKQIIQQDLKEIKIASKNDYTKISNQYNMIKNNEYLKFAQTILKPEISNYITKATTIYNKLKPYMQTEKEPEYIRGKGINVKFKDKIHYPDFVANLTKVDIKLKDATFKISIKNITNNQKLLNKPTIFNLISTSKYYKSLNINAQYFIDKLTLITKLNQLKLDSISQSNITLTKPIVDINSNIDINKNKIDSISKIQIHTQKVIYKENKLISNALNNIHYITITTKIYGQIDKPNTKIDSNIDKLLSKALNKLINKQITKQKFKLQQLINDKISSQQKNINLNIIDTTNSQLQLNKNTIDNLKQQLSKYSKNYLSKKLLKSGLSKFF